MKYMGLSVFVAASSVLPAIVVAGTDQTSQAGSQTYRERFDRIQMPLKAGGASSCAGSGCHGGMPREGEAILGKEFQSWRGCDGAGNHYKAYKTLSSPRSQIMAKLLDKDDGAGQDATQRQDCCNCHAFNVPQPLRSQRFDLADGVSCEACHGRSEKWFFEHLLPDWRKKLDAAQRTNLGYFDMRDLGHRTEKCLECHLGTESKQVTHTILAAGHPELTFELSSDLFDVPKHWKDEQSYRSDENAAGFQARTWAVGQAVALRESMLRLVRWAGGDGSPDFAMLECYACHHDLTPPPNWRQRARLDASAGTILGRLGEPGWDRAAWSGCSQVVRLVMPDALPQFDQDIALIAGSMSLTRFDRNNVRQAAQRVADRAELLVNKALDHTYTPGEIHDLVRRFAADQPAGLGYRSAEQIYRALLALYWLPLTVDGQKPPSDDPVYQAMAALQKTIGDDSEHPAPGRYDPAEFAKALRKLAQSLDGKPASPPQQSPEKRAAPVPPQDPQR